uniref:Uncharacterized protein n=1 Tax=Plectus sambesii TaxID=2011161 RepID=A0A914UX72_9BILA
MVAHQLALMQPSLQACICLQYAALRSRNFHLIRSADRALQLIFAVDVNLLRQFADYVDVVMRQSEAMSSSSMGEADFLAGFDGSSPVDAHTLHLMMQTPPPH